MEKTKKGISMIVLVITIVVMIILAGVVILALSNSGIIGKANLGRIKSDLSSLMDEVQVKAAERKLNELDIKGSYKLSDWGIENATYEDRTIISEGKLRVKNTLKNDDIEKAATELGILLNKFNFLLKNTTGENLTNYRIYGNSVQSGIPSPDSLVSIQNLGDLVTDIKDANYGKYKVSVKVSGRNLFDSSKLTLTNTSCSKELSINGNSFSFKRISTKLTSAVFVRMYFEAGTYTISGSVEQSDGLLGGFGVYDLEKSTYLVNNSDKGMNTKTFVVPESKVYSLSFFCNYNSPESTEVTFSNIMLVKNESLFDIQKNPTLSPNSLAIRNDSSIRANLINTGGWAYNFYVLDDASQYVGKKVRIKVKFTASGTNKPLILMGLSTLDGKERKNLVDVSASEKEYSFIVPDITDDKKYFGLWLYSNAGSDTAELGDYVDYSDFMIMVDEETPYEQYISPKTFDIYLNAPLLRAGNVADYIDFNEKKVIRNIKKITLTGSESWHPESGGDYYVTLTDKKMGKINLISSNYLLSNSSNSPDQSFSGRVQNRAVGFYDTTNGPTLDKWKEFLTSRYNSNNPIYLQYELETPTEESITLPDISTFEGTTMISVVGENNVSASKIEAEY